MKAEDNTEDARIARTNWFCLSCDKNLLGYQGKLGKHVVWDSMPLKGTVKGVDKKGLPSLKKWFMITIIWSTSDMIILHNSSKFFLNLNGAVQEAEHPEADRRSGRQWKIGSQRSHHRQGGGLGACPAHSAVPSQFAAFVDKGEQHRQRGVRNGVHGVNALSRTGVPAGRVEQRGLVSGGTGGLGVFGEKFAIFVVGGPEEQQADPPARRAYRWIDQSQ